MHLPCQLCNFVRCAAVYRRYELRLGFHLLWDPSRPVYGYDRADADLGEELEEKV